MATIKLERVRIPIKDLDSRSQTRKEKRNAGTSPTERSPLLSMERRMTLGMEVIELAAPEPRYLRGFLGLAGTTLNVWRGPDDIERCLRCGRSGVRPSDADVIMWSPRLTRFTWTGIWRSLDVEGRVSTFIVSLVIGRLPPTAAIPPSSRLSQLKKKTNTISRDQDERIRTTRGVFFLCLILKNKQTNKQ